jgi:Aspartokinases
MPSPKPRLVMKFGGTSVRDMTRIRAAAEKVKREVEAGWDVAVVVSAMAGETNRLVDLVREAAAPPGEKSAFYDAREYDAVVASGELVTAGLMALALQQIGVPARSWQGWQVPLRTTAAHGAARIEGIDTSARRSSPRLTRHRCFMASADGGSRPRRALGPPRARRGLRERCDI